MKEKVDLETFVIIQNVDESILNLNQVIKKYNFEFQEFTLEEFEIKFNHLINLPADFNRSGTITLEEGDISLEFYKLIVNHPEFGISILGNRKIYLLRSLKSCNIWKEENNINMKGLLPYCKEVQTFVESLLTQLRIFKIGDINYSTIFQLYPDTRKVAFKYTNKFPSSKRNEFKITLFEVRDFEKFYKPNFEPNELVKLAIENFNLTYEIFNPKIEFILMISALESILNIGKDQISHTISRHLALIISCDKRKFEINYKKIKDLYALRSYIVHGTDTKKIKDLNEKLSDLKDYVRITIRYCLKIELEKIDLFHLLNSQGTK